MNKMHTLTLYRRALLLSTICLLMLAIVVIRQERRLVQSLRRQEQTRQQLQASRDETSAYAADYYRAVFQAEKVERERDALWKQRGALETQIMEQSKKRGNKRTFFAHCPCPAGICP